MSSRAARLVKLALKNSKNNNELENIQETEIDIANLEVVFEEDCSQNIQEKYECLDLGRPKCNGLESCINTNGECDGDIIKATNTELICFVTESGDGSLEILKDKSSCIVLAEMGNLPDSKNELNFFNAPDKTIKIISDVNVTKEGYLTTADKENRFTILEDESNNTVTNLNDKIIPEEESLEEDLENDPDFVPTDNNVEEENNESDEPEEKYNKKRRHFPKPGSWEKNISKKKRMLGQEYVGYTRENGIVKHSTPRNKRSMGPKCESAFCKKTANRFCHLFSDNIRQVIFDKFWNMTWEQKQLYVIHMVSYVPKKRNYTQGTSRRNGTFNYYLKTEDGKHQVCKKLFLATLGLNEKMVLNWVNEGKYGLSSKQEDKDKEKHTKKRTCGAALELERRSKYLLEFLKGQPKMESHYCRQRTAKLYLEQDFKSKQEVYSIYKTKCLEDDEVPLSYFSFDKKFEELNLALFKPRKDLCDLCVAYKMKQLDDATYEAHILAKDQARREKDLDKIKAEQNLLHCFTMDVQAVKLCPQLEASSLYYKTKLQVHNFTVYNLATKDSKNFVWTEVAGELCASVFASCIAKHLSTMLQNDPKPIIIYSDSCGYQNKNVIMSNVLSLLATRFAIDIEQKFLEKGHTNMECDSTHSLIERRLKGRDIFLPTDYIEIIKQARKNPKALEVEYLSYNYFLNYDDSKCMRYRSIRPGKGKNDLKVTDIRCLKYLPSGEIMYKTNYSEPYISLPQRKTNVDLNYIPKPLYSERLKIKKASGFIYKNSKEFYHRTVIFIMIHCYITNSKTFPVPFIIKII